MTWYDFLKFMHILCAALWVGGSAMAQFFGIRALSAASGERLAQFAKDIEWIGFRVLVPFSAGAFLFGLGLVWNASFWGFGDDWIVIGLVLFAVTFLAGFAFFGPESGRVAKLIDAQGVDSPEVQARIRRLLVLTRIDLVVLFLIIFDMAVKPSFSDGWTIVGGLAGGAALAVLFTTRGRGPAASAAPATE